MGQRSFSNTSILLSQFILTILSIFLSSTYLFFSSFSKEGNTYISSISSLRTCVILGKTSLLRGKTKKNKQLIDT